MLYAAYQNTQKIFTLISHGKVYTGLEDMDPSVFTIH